MKRDLYQYLFYLLVFKYIGKTAKNIDENNINMHQIDIAIRGCQKGE